MSRRIVVIFIIMNVFFFFVPFYLFSQTSILEEDTYQIIPDDAIRLRILANSDLERDQHLKYLVRDKVSEQVTHWVQNISDIEEARQLIQKQIPQIEATAKRVLEEEHIDQDVQVAYGKNVTFPVKLYDTYLYPAGEYEAILITLGEGKGSNWWCVLFPPLCFLDFSNGTIVDEDSEEFSEEDLYAHNEEQDTVTEETEIQQKETEEAEEQPVKIKFFLFEWLGWS